MATTVVVGKVLGIVMVLGVCLTGSLFFCIRKDFSTGRGFAIATVCTYVPLFAVLTGATEYGDETWQD